MLFAADSEKSPASRIVLGSAAGVAILAAVYLSLGRGGTASEQLNTAASAEPYVCLSDQHEFTLTPAQFDAKLRADEGRTDSPDGSRGGVMKLKCPKCGQFTAVKAVRCPKDQAIVPIVDAQGKLGRCPKCGAAPDT
jgi:hypothetical protein